MTKLRHDRRPELFRRARSVASAGLLAAMPLLMGAEGGCPLMLQTLESPVQAITVLQENADGSVEVDLMLVRVDGTTQEWITSASNAELRTPDGNFIPLEMAEDGHYRAHSDEFPELLYVGDDTNYRVTFDIDDEEIAGDAAGEEFIAVVSAPADEITFELTKAPDFAGDTATITWTPSKLAGLLEIRDASGEVIYSTFNLQTPEFDGSKWASLVHGGSEQLRVDVFADPGEYTLSFCAVRSQEGLDEELSAGLGILSGFLAGRCAEDITIDVIE
jgi:hypothetical protein